MPDPEASARNQGFYEVRVATLEDTAHVETLLSASYPALMRNEDAMHVIEAAMPLMCTANPTLLSSGRYYVAVPGADAGAGERVGAVPDVLACGGWSTDWSAGYRGDSLARSDVGHIRHVGTHPDFLGHGMGRAIIERAFHDGAAVGVKDWHVFSSRNAIGFYTRCGFSDPEEILLDFPGGLELPSWHMKKFRDRT